MKTFSVTHTPFRTLLACSLVSLLFTGCNSEQNSKPAEPTTDGAAESTDSMAEKEIEAPIEPGKTVEITLILSDAKGFEEILAKQKGKVVLVDFWATWCIPCVKNFHHTVEWNKKYADQGLTVISVSMDDADEETEKAVLKFLEKEDAQFTNVLATAAEGQDPMEAFGIDDGALPHYRIYDRSGKLVKKFFFKEPDQSFTEADIQTAFEAALKQKPE